MKPLRVLGCGLLVLAVAAMCTRAGDNKRGKDNPPGASKKAAEIKKLLKERRDTLAEVLSKVTDLWRGGLLGDFTKLAQAQRDLLKATLELTDSPKERMALLQQQKQTAEAIVQFAKSKQGIFVTGLDVLQARAGLLEVQIELLREELKVEPRK